MNGWRQWAYAFPTNDDLDTLFEVIELVPGQFAVQLDYEFTGMAVVTAANANAALYLRLAFGENDLIGSDGRSNLEGNEVLIRDHQRAECEAILQDNCPSEAKWFDLMIISAQTDEAQQAFHDAYRAVVGHSTAVM
jgi:hypothetical protein